MTPGGNVGTDRGACVSVPGKAILIGEHAAVYGHPAVVATLPRRVYVAARRTAADPGVLLRLRGRGVSVDVRRSWRDVELRGAAAREDWSAFDRNGAPLTSLVKLPGGSLQSEGIDSLVAFLDVALYETWRQIAPSTSAQLPGLQVQLRSELPVGAGCGSSAAVAVAVAAAVAKALARAASNSELAAIAQHIERRQHGRPSGVDVAAVLGGGILVARSGPSGGRPTVRSIVSADSDLVPEHPLTSMVTVLTGQRPESTGAVVEAVRRQLERSHTAAVEARAALSSLGSLARQLERHLVAETARGAHSETPEFGRLIAAAQRGLERLGVVPSPIADWLADLRRHGIYGKVSGAGSLLGPGAGLVILAVSSDQRAQVEVAAESAGFEVLGVGLGCEGLRSEPDGFVDRD